MPWHGSCELDSRSRTSRELVPVLERLLQSNGVFLTRNYITGGACECGEKGGSMDLAGLAPSEATSRLERCARIHRIDQALRGVLAVTTVVKKQPGGSQSRLVRCDDGKLYVLKMTPNPQGPNVLANEVLGSILMRGLGLPAPPWKPVAINLKTLRLFPELAMQTAATEVTRMRNPLWPRIFGWPTI